MKSKRSRKDQSSEESDVDEWSIEQKKESASDASSEEVSKKSKKRKKKRVSSSESDSDDSEAERKKRKHKKKKKKHSKKKRKESTDESDSESEEEVSSQESEGDSPVTKKRHKHKHKHSSKHSKKKRQSQSETEYPEAHSGKSVAYDEEEYNVDKKSSRSQHGKMKSICMGRAPSAEQIISDEEDYSRDTRTRKPDDSYNDHKPHYDNRQKTSRYYEEQNTNKRVADHRSTYRGETDHRRMPEPQSLPRQYSDNHNRSSRPDVSRERPVDTARHNKDRHDLPRSSYGGNNDQYYAADKRVDTSGNSGYHKYDDNNKHDRRNTGNYYDKKYPQTDRYGNPMNHTYNKDRQDYKERVVQHGDNRYEGNNNRGQDYNRKPHYQHGDSNKQDGGNNYVRKDYVPRGDQGNNSRYNQDGGNYPSTSNQSRRYERDDRNSKDVSHRRDDSTSKPRDNRTREGMTSVDRRSREDNNRDEGSNRRTVSNNRNKSSRFGGGSKNSDEEKEYEWGKKDNNVKVEDKGSEKGDKDKPNFGLSGKLTEDANTVNGVVLKYTEPPEARKPKRRWRFYPFKGDKALAILYIHRQSSFLLGRDRKVADIPLDHPSISKQHAALQYRLVPFTRDDGSTGKRIRPYIIDLGSANGTFVNNKMIDPQKYVELLERDVVKFGFSQREYVLLHENSREEGTDDDDVKHSGGEERAYVKSEHD